MGKALDPRKTYEFIDFNDTQAAIDFMKKNPGWDLYGQRTMDKYVNWGDGAWTKTKIYRVKESP